MQLIAVGDALLNLDRISVLDFDRTPGGIVLRVRGDGPQPIMELTVPVQTIAGIMSLVPQKFRFGGSDKQDE
jgi:hypothetical protein